MRELNIVSVKILYLENHATFAQQVISQFLKSHQITVIPSLAAARHWKADFEESTFAASPNFSH